MGHIVTADKAHHWLPGGHHRMYRHLRFLCCASIIAGLVAAALWTGRLSRITRLTLRSCSPRLSCCSASFGEELGVTNFDAVGEILRQPVEKVP
jgi:hypothetical protein